MRKVSFFSSVFVAVIAVAALAVSCEKGDTMLNHIYITSPTEKVAPDDTVFMTLHAYPEGANAGFPDAPIVWSSSDTTVATVNQSGCVIALKFGYTTIRVDYGKLFAEKNVTVSNVAGFRDSNLSKFLLDRFDTNGDGILEGYETASYTGIDLSDLVNYAYSDTVDMYGLDNFVNVQVFRMERVNVKNLDFSLFPNLREVHLDACGIDEVDLRSATELTDVRIMACPNLKRVILGSYADYGKNNLRTFQCSRCDISELDLTRCGATLWDVDVAGNASLASLDLSVDTMLHSIVYSCEATTVSWPVGISLDAVYQECQ